MHTKDKIYTEWTPVTDDILAPQYEGDSSPHTEKQYLCKSIDGDIAYGYIGRNIYETDPIWNTFYCQTDWSDTALTEITHFRDLIL
jgi:hypothetical protein